jgi:hypothetical protein
MKAEDWCFRDLDPGQCKGEPGETDTSVQIPLTLRERRALVNYTC